MHISESTIRAAAKVNPPTKYTCSRVFVVQSDWFRHNPDGGSQRCNPPPPPPNVTRLSSPFREREPGNEAVILLLLNSGERRHHMELGCGIISIH